VAAGTIDVRRAAVIRGAARSTGGAPLSGVIVEVLDHPEYGSTRTFADGMFAMAVNGGGPLVVTYRSDGYLPVARQVEVPWQDYARAADVVMTAYDTAMTSIDLSAAAAAVARGSVVADADGVRQATLIFPAGTQAQMALPGGAMVPISTRRRLTGVGGLGRVQQASFHSMSSFLLPGRDGCAGRILHRQRRLGALENGRVIEIVGAAGVSPRSTSTERARG
jgi:hypothetical protein